VAIGSLAAKAPERFLAWLEQFGAGRLILAADVKAGYVATGGWQQHSEHRVGPYISQMRDAGLQDCLCTDIQRDGMLEGPALELYEGLLAVAPGLNLIASGGIRDIADLTQLWQLGIADAIVGKALYEGRLEPAALADWAQSLNSTPSSST
jgi:phosphoribosylformimino-5-aminoimidazole carboxamide ribotide isomerase